MQTVLWFRGVWGPPSGRGRGPERNPHKFHELTCDRGAGTAGSHVHSSEAGPLLPPWTEADGMPLRH